MQLRYNYRVYPTPGQQESLARSFGCARVVFNDGLRLRQQAREAGEKYLSDAELSKRVITQAKATPERVWLGEVSSVVLQQALADLNTAYRNFFASLSGKRKGRKVAPPRFRSRKDNRQAIRFTKNSRFTVLDNGRLRLPKIGDVEVRWSRGLPSEASSVTVIRDAAGRYFASFVVQTTEDETLPSAGSEVGIDLGLTHFAVMSDGTKVAAPTFLRRAARKLRRLQQDLSRKQRGSQNRKKAVVKIARAHARVADTRRDWQHKLSTTLIRENQAVYVEDLCVVGLGRTRLAKSVHDAGWASFTGMLEYKAARYGRTFARVDRFFPSTRMCSDCGRINEKMALDVRAWDCPCGSHHDRDVNAAKNVKAAGQADFNDRGAQVRPAAMLAPRGEAVTHPDAACSTRSVEGISVLRAERMSSVSSGASVAGHIRCDTVDEERRYAEEPEPRWHSGQNPYDSGVHERPDHAFRLPESRPGDAPRFPLTGGVDSLAPSSTYSAADPSTYPKAEPGGYSAVDRYRADDPLTTTGSFTRGSSHATRDAHATRDGGDPAPPRTALDAIRVPLRATEYPAVRPGAATSPGDTGTKLSAPTSAAPTSAAPMGTGPAGTGPMGTAAAGGGAGYNEPTSLVPPIGARTGDGRLGGDAVYRTRRPAAAVVFAVVTALLMVPVVRLLIQATFVDPPQAGGIVPAVLMTLGLPLTGFGLYGVAGAGRAMDRNALLRPPAGYLLVGLALLAAAGLATG